MEDGKKVSLSLAIARMGQKMYTLTKNKSVGGRYRYATLDHMLSVFHRNCSKDIPLGIYFNEKYLGNDTYEMECVLYHVDGGDERRSSAIVTVTNGDIPKSSNGSLQVNAVQWAGEKQTYMMRMAMRGALGISPNDDTDCHHGVERTGYAATNLK
jgi:hypothetical protein